ncbi:hypothetical protein [Cupriavidus agavae]|uniref:Uncharacterized protein n=1 Tax=Cupriavidus agavae TaxID=1001822 RepID=A0A4Q7RDR3_9BURK|nr:hypothetical protein [Cupriavidus agavae]RZT31311.1 hypothetical protein EV147_4492 [Cupriavidus agavae]
MRMQWEKPDIPQYAEPDPPPAWLLLTLLVLTLGIGATYVVVSWPAGQAMRGGDFVMRALILPLTVYVAAVSLLTYLCYEERVKAARWWNLMLFWRNYDWLCWARGHAVLVDSVVLTPEPDVAERMLGLEGMPPANAGKVLKLDIAASPGATRMAHVLTQLLTPLLDAIHTHSKRGRFRIVLQSSAGSDEAELRRIMRQLGLSPQLEVVWKAAGASAPMDWLWDEGWGPSGAHLLLACQLHQDDQSAADSEMAAALLLSDDAGRSAGAQACLFRPVFARSDAVGSALATLLKAGQAPVDRIRQIWHAGLGKPATHAVATAVRDVPLDAASHVLDTALGKPGPASGWVAQALAARMVQYAQGAQLIATPCREGVSLNLIGSPPALPDEPSADAPPPQSLLWAAGVAATLLALFFLEIDTAAPGSGPPAELWRYPAFLATAIVLQIGAALWRLRGLRNEFSGLARDNPVTPGSQSLP